jgi:hypothetical protein
LPALERAYVFLQLDSQNVYFLEAQLHWDPTISVRRTPPRVKFQTANLGKTPAIIKWMAFEMSCGVDPPSVKAVKVEPVPGGELVIASGAIHPEPIRSSIGGSEAFSRSTEHVDMFLADTHLDHVLSEEEVASIVSGECFLWFYGKIVYDDVFGANHEIGFCWRFNSPHKFEPYGGTEYNYRT